MAWDALLVRQLRTVDRVVVEIVFRAVAGRAVAAVREADIRVMNDDSTSDVAVVALNRQRYNFYFAFLRFACDAATFNLYCGSAQRSRIRSAHFLRRSSVHFIFPASFNALMRADDAVRASSV